MWFLNADIELFKLMKHALKIFLPATCILAFLFEIFLSTMFSDGEINTTGDAIVASIISILIAIGLIFLCKKVHLFNGTPKVKLDWKMAIMLLIAIPGIHLLINKITFVFEDIYRIDYVLSTSNTEEVTAAAYGFSIFHALLIAPIVEEIILRKVLMDCYNSSLGKILAFVLCALMFANMQSSESVIFSAIFAIGMSFIYLLTKNIKINIAIHYITNTLAIITSLIQVKINNASILSSAGNTIYSSAAIWMPAIAVSCVVIAIYIFLGHKKGWLISNNLINVFKPTPEEKEEIVEE